MFPPFVMLSFRFSILLLWTGAIATARQSEHDTEIQNKSTVTKSTPKSTKSQKSKTTPAKADGSETAQDEKARTSGIELSAPRKMQMQFGMRFLSNDNYCNNLYETIQFPMNWPEPHRRVAGHQGLLVRVHRNEFDTSHAIGNHAVDRILPAATHADHFDLRRRFGH